MSCSYLLDNRSEHAVDRFDALSAVFDEVTFRHLDALGVARGWRCWEVGAGGPSVAMWLASRAGPSVVASDIDVRWLADNRLFQIVRHDVVADPPPRPGFDLVHVRLVLTHLPRRAAALANLARCLRPGGWLVVEDFDVGMQPRATADPVTAMDHLANRIRAGFVALLAGRGVDRQLGRTLPRRLRSLGLVDVCADAYFPLALPAVAELERANVEQVREALIGLGVATNAELDAYLDAVGDLTLDVATPPLVSAWGRRPTSS